MAPKGKAKAEPKAKATAPPSQSLPIANVNPAALGLEVNAKYEAKLQVVVMTVNEHPIFAGLAKEKPLSTTQAPFALQAFQRGMQESKVYRCAGNAMWLKVQAPTTLPMREKKVGHVIEHYFSRPVDVFPSVVQKIGIDEAVVGDASCKVIPTGDDNLGKLELISPCEVLHALIFRIGEDIRNGVSDEDLQIWRRCLLNVPMEFTVIIHQSYVNSEPADSGQ